MERVTRKLLSYIVSHRYDLHALLVSFLVLAVMFWLSKKLRMFLEKKIEKLCETNPEYYQKKEILLKRSNLFIILGAFVLSVFFYALVAYISPFITFSISAAVMSGVFVLFEYALIRQIMAR